MEFRNVLYLLFRQWNSSQAAARFNICHFFRLKSESWLEPCRRRRSLGLSTDHMLKHCLSELALLSSRALKIRRHFSLLVTGRQEHSRKELFVLWDSPLHSPSFCSVSLILTENEFFKSNTKQTTLHNFVNFCDAF